MGTFCPLSAEAAAAFFLSSAQHACVHACTSACTSTLQHARPARRQAGMCARVHACCTPSSGAAVRLGARNAVPLLRAEVKCGLGFHPCAPPFIPRPIGSYPACPEHCYYPCPSAAARAGRWRSLSLPDLVALVMVMAPSRSLSGPVPSLRLRLIVCMAAIWAGCMFTRLLAPCTAADVCPRDACSFFAACIGMRAT